LRDIIKYLENQKIFHDVKTIKKALDCLKLEIDPAKNIVVAGTNGKGTTAATLQTLLMEAGKNVGFFSSPHLIKINERIKFNGQDISDDDFIDVFCKVHDKIQAFNLSYFEYLTLMFAYYVFGRNKADFAIFEVGLGGTHDSTNAVPHDTSVIAKLGMDHESILGNTMLKIAENKFGIISENNKVFHIKFDSDEIIKLSKEISRKRNADFIESYPYEFFPLSKIKIKGQDLQMNLLGARAAENTALAITVFDHFVPDSRQFLPAIGKVNWPGRMEITTYQNREIFMSGDHNPQGIDSLLDILKHFTFQNVHFVVGICYDKNHSKMLEKLSGLPNSLIYLTETPEKTLSIKNYEERFLKTAKFVSSDPILALDAAISNSTERDLVVITGSLYLIGKIKNLAPRYLHGFPS